MRGSRGAWIVALAAAALAACAGSEDPLDIVDAAEVADAVAQADAGMDVGAAEASAGACRSAADCYGGDFCASARECSAGRCVNVGRPANCDDGIACTLDRCDAAAGACVHEPLNGMCPMGRFCDPTQGCVVPPTCEAGDTPCQRLNHDPCGGTWSCDPASLRCVRSAPVDCDDRNPCTIDSCRRDGSAAVCGHASVPNDCGTRMCGQSPSGCFTCGSCADGRVCSGGACVCPSGESLCSGACVNTSVSATNCGACGRVCASGQSCVSGACVVTGCPGGGTLCSGACVNTQSESANCGACGRACPTGQYCAGGSCRCNSGTLCGGSCVDTNSNNAHCGTCGRACGSNQQCQSGVCVITTCPGAETLCSGTCVNTQSESANCGACGRACPTGQYCAGGSCRCNSGTLCGGSCVDTSSDRNNCGACGRVCGSGQACMGGSCGGYCGNGVCDAGEGCQSCAQDCARAETANYLDDNCNGLIDDGVRTRLNRLHNGGGLLCTANGASWDHCFSTGGSGSYCAGSGQGGGSGYVADGNTLYVYPLSLGGGGSTVYVGPYLLARLDSCYDAASSRHRYVTFDFPSYPHSWSCSPVGYVKTGVNIGAGDNLVYYEHYLSRVTTYFYDTNPGGGGGLESCGLSHAPAWFAWTY